MEIDDILKIIEEIDIIKKEAVQDQRFLGEIKRCREFKYKA